LKSFGGCVLKGKIVMIALMIYKPQ